MLLLAPSLRQQLVLVLSSYTTRSPGTSCVKWRLVRPRCFVLFQSQFIHTNSIIILIYKDRKEKKMVKTKQS